MATIAVIAPDPRFTGTRAGVPFQDGRGEVEADKAHLAMQRLHELDPTLRVSNLRDWLPIHRPEDFARFAEGLRLAGLPE